MPERDAYALVLVAVSPELGGSAGIGGVTRPPDRGAGGMYGGERPSAAEALLHGLGDSLLIVILVTGLAALAGAVALGDRRERSGPRTVP